MIVVTKLRETAYNNVESGRNAVKCVGISDVDMLELLTRYPYYGEDKKSCKSREVRDKILKVIGEVS